MERMSQQPVNQEEEQIKVGDDQFRFKKFNSQRFDPSQINLKTLEIQLNSLVEELTQDDKELFQDRGGQVPSDMNRAISFTNFKPDVGVQS